MIQHFRRINLKDLKHRLYTQGLESMLETRRESQLKNRSEQIHRIEDINLKSRISAIHWKSARISGSDNVQPMHIH